MTATSTSQRTVSDLGHQRDFAIQADRLRKTYDTSRGPVEALSEISIGIPRGEFTAVMGLSGSGKSTLVHLLSGLDSPTSGRVWIDGTDISAMNDNALSRLRSERLGFVFQSFNLLPNLTVRKNIELPMDLWGRSPDPAWLDYVIDLVGIGEKLDQLAANLSGGQRQRVAIARALASNPSVIVADEPTGSLDLVNGESVLRLFRTLADNGHTVLMVTHDPGAASYSDQVLVLRDGQLVGSAQSPDRAWIREQLMDGAGV